MKTFRSSAMSTPVNNTPASPGDDIYVCYDASKKHSKPSLGAVPWEVMSVNQDGSVDIGTKVVKSYVRISSLIRSKGIQ